MIRNYTLADFETLKSWWVAADEPGPTIEMLPEDSTFILEVDGVPKMSISVYLTNTNYLAYLECFIKNPEINYKNNYTQQIIDHAEQFARSKGVKILVCLSYREKLKQRYQEFGYHRTLDNLSGFAKQIQ